MSEARLIALLLPLGIWLIQSGSTSQGGEAVEAARGLVVMAISTLCYTAVGFGFMFGGIGAATNLPDFAHFVTYYTLPVANQTWGLVGLHGFMLDGLSEPALLQLYLSYLPLTIACSLLLVQMLGQRVSIIWQIVVTVLTSGILFPVFGFWIWGGGWLSSLGLNLSLGHGAVDFGGLGTAALVAGGAGLAWLLFLPHKEQSERPEFPSTRFPFRSLTGIFLALTGTAAVVAGSPLLSSSDTRVADAHLLYGVVAVSVAVLVTLLYSVLTSRRPELHISARAATGALIAVSVGSILLPLWAVLFIGLLAGLLTTFGLYITNEIIGWQDDSGLLTSALLPAVLGFIALGLFANGTFGQGYHGIGPESYLGVTKLGITGLLPPAGASSDPGQLTAQLAAALTVITVSFAFSLPFVYAWHWLAKVQFALPTEPEKASTILESFTPDLPKRASSPEPVPVQTAPMEAPAGNLAEVTPPLAEPIHSATPNEIQVAEPKAADHDLSAMQPANSLAEPTPAPAKRKETLLERLRRARSSPKETERPVQARHVAYPNRVGGKRLSIRPMRPVDDSNTAETSKPAK